MSGAKGGFGAVEMLLCQLGRRSKKSLYLFVYDRADLALFAAVVNGSLSGYLSSIGKKCSPITSYFTSCALASNI